MRKCPVRVQINKTSEFVKVLVNDDHDHVHEEEVYPIRTQMSDLVKTKIGELYSKYVYKFILVILFLY